MIRQITFVSGTKDSGQSVMNTTCVPVVSYIESIDSDSMNMQYQNLKNS